MKFLGLFVVSCILLVICVSVFGNLWGGVGLLALPALFLAAAIRVYMSIDERLEEIEWRLGITPEEEPKTFSEQVMENNQKEE